MTPRWISGPAAVALAGLAAVFGIAAPGTAAPRIKVLKVAVANPSGEARPAENVVLRADALRAIAPDLLAGSLVVTTSAASTLEEDAAVLAAEELASQADDLDGDGRVDEIAFQIPLQPRQTRIVTLAYGPMDTIGRLRARYPVRTGAAFAKKYEGLGWESEVNAWRVYFDARNAVDLFGKRRAGLMLPVFAAPEYDYHQESPLGRDIYKNGEAIGIGSAAAWEAGAVVKVADVQQREWRILATGAVRSVAELTYKGWAVGGRRVDMVARITQWAGERGFEHRVTFAAEGPRVVTGLPIKPGVDPIREREGNVAVLATWGAQVLEPGATATASLPDQKLGLAVLAPGDAAPGVPPNDGVNHLLPVAQGRWYVMAAWDQERAERLAGWGREGSQASRLLPAQAITTAEAFRAAVTEQARVIAMPATVSILSKKAAPQTAPLSSLAGGRRKTYREAIALLRRNAEQSAARFLPLLQAEGNAVTRDAGDGFFVEADAKTGAWKPHKGHYWTGSFWVGTLWRLYEHTGDVRFRQWAEAWNAPMMGQESVQNHDIGFQSFYSSAFAYDRTKDDKYRSAALAGAERLKALFQPEIGMVTAWGDKGNDTIIDTMMNLQIWWWTSRITGDASWRELGHRHAKKTLEWLVRADGSTYQSVHYNPGNDPQEFKSTRIEIHYPNRTAKGEWIFKHTHQGWSADTCWSRGQAWALYGFTRAYQETGDAAFLEAARKMAAFAIDRLPEDGVPWYDFHDEGVMFRNRDTSAGALLAMGLLLLADAETSRPAAEEYRAQGRRIVQSLIDRYLTPVTAGDTQAPGVLQHACWTRPMNGALVYGQYYLLEALLHLDGKRPARPAARSAR